MRYYNWYFSDRITTRLRQSDAFVVERLDPRTGKWIVIDPANGIDERIATDPTIVETDGPPLAAV